MAKTQTQPQTAPSKTFQVIEESGEIQLEAGTLINTGSTIINCVDSETFESMADLPEEKKKSVLSAMYAINPNETLKVEAGLYYLDLGFGFTGSAVLMAGEAE